MDQVEIKALLKNLVKQNRTLLLGSLVGSKAYGLETEHSDNDYLGVVAARTMDLVGLNRQVETHKFIEIADSTFHEAVKFCSLALRVNPTLTELLWMPEENYFSVHWLGAELIDIREAFLSRDLVRASYLGYAMSQFEALKERKGSFGPDLNKRTEKHARHLYRLLHQGLGLLQTGMLLVKVAEPEKCFEFGRETARLAEEGAFDWLEFELARWKEKYSAALLATDLPLQPNVEIVESWLRKVRVEFWSE